jgi:DNA-binding NarL/FixJ family response regulator
VPIRVVIVDDHSIVREGLRVFLARDAEIVIVADAVDGVAALEVARQQRPDVILMDLLMPRMDGIEATKLIRAELPDTQVIALTSVLDDSYVAAVMGAGAIGYLLKDTRPDELCRAIRLAVAKQVELSPAVAERLVRAIRSPATAESLTGREVEILRYVASGLSNKEIARLLCVGEKTVKTHVSNILSKLGFQSRTQAALFAARNGLVDGLLPTDAPPSRSNGSNSSSGRQPIGILLGRPVRRRPTVHGSPAKYPTVDRPPERFGDSARRHLA